ncbi:adenine phosphoribosyltransferase [Parapedobacter pyrenivorans]|uniref:Adenine phosphoribosyltransferase n=1 Tax=Parapedobacter pyrenivorans TaxID=1305674 RepID=A0A917MB81_9SPHI|nr:adenine phosphoribosyltransferase [Parapedobacter pyrenivorans]GGG89016.1 adenine phosphoribosyltransferase [Parapedobacter pyrenivorans]
MIDQQLKSVIRDIPDFPKQGVVFKDITPILKDPKLCGAVVDGLLASLPANPIDVVAGIESRGFLFGLTLAQRLGKPFVPIRKVGKLPYHTVKQEYTLEYGNATIEIHEDAFAAGARVLVHDDLLATGGTVIATSKLIQKLGGSIAGYAFIISLDFLKGREQLHAFSPHISSLVSYG